MMTSKISALVALSSRIDDIIEMGAGVMSEEALASIFGKGGGWGKYARSGVAKAAVNPGVASPVLSSASMATGGVRGPSLLNRIASARSAATAGISAPVEAGGRGIGAVTGAPVAPRPLSNFLQRNVAPGAVSPGAVAPATPGLFHGISGAPQSPGPFSAMGAAPAATAGTAVTSTANAANQVANQAGQNIAAGNAAINKGKQIGRKVGATGAGLLAGGVMAVPDWMTRQNTQSMSAWIDHIIQFADPRPRNPLGEFSGQEGGPDANAMATVYKMPQMQPQGGGGGVGIPKLAGAALVGGALGQIGGNIGKEGWQGMTKLVKHLHKQAKLRK